MNRSIRLIDITYFCNMKNLVLFTIFLGLATTVATAQSARVYYNAEAEQAYYIHEVQPKETLYGLTKTYGVNVRELVELNELSSTDLSLGQKLFIPFNNEIVEYIQPEDRAQYLAVYYQVKRKETLFRICRRYFKLNLTAIKELNGQKRNALRINQKLLLGYIPRYQQNAFPSLPAEEPIVEIPVEEAVTIETPAEGEHQDIEITDQAEGSLYAVKEETGAAFWNKDMASSSGYFVLHRYAAKNTWLEVTNQMYGNSIRAKVIGNIPSNGYPDDVLVVLSPAIAKDLGALDARFYVKVRYLSAQPQPTSSK